MLDFTIDTHTLDLGLNYIEEEIKQSLIKLLKNNTNLMILWWSNINNFIQRKENLTLFENIFF